MFTPDYADATGIAKHLNSNELKELLNKDDMLEEMIKSLQQVKKIENEKEMLILSNKSLAEYNLSLQPELERCREELIKLYKEAEDLQSKVVSKKSELGGIKSHNDSETVLALLQTAAAEAEEDSENHFQKLLDGLIPLDDFINDYLKKRTKVHILRTKSEKLRNLLLLPNGVSVTPPEKPTRTKKAPPLPPIPVPPSSVISPTRLPYPNVPMPGFPIAPIKTTASHGEPVILPVRQAPRPPVHIPRRSSNPPAVNVYPPVQSPNVSQRQSSMPPVPNGTHNAYPPQLRYPLPN